MTTPHALIIEDDLASQEILAHLLREQGASVLALGDPRLVRMDDLSGVRVIFLDLELPGLDGYEFFDRLRHEMGCVVPVIAYSVNTNEMATARALGFNGFLAKPLDSTAFGRHFARILRGEAVWEIA